ncbi:hypothetical protein QN277_025035 [Acacia crassicarpa]|uniref:Uncharacterized protein n=1 Tax=Acacia crassicarpa TaxID=499986 RepID=A0AAE1JGK6_9FABA|nr:hypothetical protein QN277_025035 [Acacia crassicarpa]
MALSLSPFFRFRLTTPWPVPIFAVTWMVLLTFMVVVATFLPESVFCLGHFTFFFLLQPVQEGLLFQDAVLRHRPQIDPCGGSGCGAPRARITGGAISHGWKKLKEWSEIVAGPRWKKTFIRCFKKGSYNGYKKQGLFRYTASSCAQILSSSYFLRCPT